MKGGKKSSRGKDESIQFEHLIALNNQYNLEGRNFIAKIVGQQSKLIVVAEKERERDSQKVSGH